MSRATPSFGQTLTIRFLLIGFGTTLMLVALTMTVAVLGVTHVEHITLQLADQSDRSTYYLGDVAEQLARLRAHLSVGLDDTPARFSRRLVSIHHIDRVLSRDRDALEKTFIASRDHRWKEIEGELLRLQRVYRQAAALLGAGKRADANALMRREAKPTMKVHEALDQLQHAHRTAVLAELAAARRHTSRERLIEVVLMGLFLAGTLVTWTIILRIFRRQRKQIHEYTARLELVNADLDAFAGRVAHDLKNPLGAVAVASDLLQTFSGDRDKVVDIAGDLRECSQRANGMADALLAFSRQAGHAETERTTAEVKRAVEQTIAELQPRIDELDVTVDASDIARLRVRCSDGLLNIILANLCGNAVKYLAGAPERRMRISVLREAELCRIDIADTGPGIPEDAQRRIFEPFYRVAGNHAPGTGIGLATVHRILEATGGRITVDSTPGQGSVFHVWLPVDRTSGHTEDEASAVSSDPKHPHA